MTQVPLLRGIYVTAVGEMVASLPINYEPVVLETGLSDGYLRPAPGITAKGTGPGADRGGIVWNNVQYRVMGTKFVSVSAAGAVTILGDVGQGATVSLDYGFDRVSIASANHLFYWDGSALSVVTDTNLGVVLDAMFLSGYYLTTDGNSIVATDLNDPYTVNPLKYGSAEVRPDAIVALAKINGEMFALGTNTIQGFSNVGGNGFPFANNPGAEVPRGCVGTHAWAYFLETLALVGSALGEAPGVYIMLQGTTTKISDRTVDLALAALSPSDLAAVTVESRIEKNEQRLIVHLPAASYAYFHNATIASKQPIWTMLASGAGMDGPYGGRNATLASGQWWVGDASGNLGVLDSGVSTQFGVIAGRQFDTILINKEGGRAIVHAVELIGVMGASAFGVAPIVFYSQTTNGVTWSQERPASPGRAGARASNVQWRRGRRIDTWMGLRFREADAGLASWASLNVTIEGLG